MHVNEYQMDQLHTQWTNKNSAYNISTNFYVFIIFYRGIQVAS